VRTGVDPKAVVSEVHLGCDLTELSHSFDRVMAEAFDWLVDPKVFAILLRLN
jgi:hypothetical protein